MGRNTIPIFSLGGTIPVSTLGGLRMQVGKEHQEEPELFSQNLFSFWQCSYLLACPETLCPFNSSTRKEKACLGWIIEWLFTGWDYSWGRDFSSLLTLEESWAVVLGKLNCQSFPPEQITKQLETQKRGGREWKRAVLSLVPAYVCSWSLLGSVQIFPPWGSVCSGFWCRFSFALLSYQLLECLPQSSLSLLS